MKRVLFDIPKWHLLQHRDCRELPLPRAGDGPRLRLEDELFERLHAGELDALPPDGVNPALAAWAQRFHASYEALPVFGRLAAHGRGDPAAAAAATETILGLIDIPPRGTAFRRSTRLQRRSPPPSARRGLRRRLPRRGRAPRGHRGPRHGRLRGCPGDRNREGHSP